MNDLGLLDALKNHIGIYNLDLPQHLRDEIEEFMEKTQVLKLKKRKPGTRKIKKKQLKIDNFTRKKMRKKTVKHHKKEKRNKTRKKK